MSAATQTKTDTSERCAALNDLCRKGRLPSGRMIFTRNALHACLPKEGNVDPSQLALIVAQRTLANAVAGFVFDGSDDTYGERDFGTFDLHGARFFFKIDYYDLDLCCGSEDPSNPAITQRVCTVMLASDY